MEKPVAPISPDHNLGCFRMLEDEYVNLDQFYFPSIQSS